MVRLPAEVLLQIFCNIKSAAVLARLESVCKQWYSILRSEKNFWRNDWLEEKEAKNLEPKIWDATAYKRFQALFHRSGGKLDSLFLPLSIPHLKDEEIEQICQKLPTTDVRRLSISLSVDRIARKVSREDAWNRTRHIYEDITKREKVRLLRAGELVLRAIVQCSKLTNLRLCADYEISLPDDYVKIVRKWKIRNCKLENVYLVGVNYSSIFRDERTRCILSQVRILGLISFNDEEDLWNILGHVKEKLKVCYIRILLEQPIPSKQMFFPRLKKLTIMDKSATNLRFLVLPKLTQLNLMDGESLRTIEDSILSQLKHLHISLRDNRRAYSPEGIAERLAKCKKLTDLSFSLSGFLSRSIENIGIGCQTLPLKRLASLAPIPDKYLLEFFRHRSIAGEDRQIPLLQRYGPPFLDQFFDEDEDYESWRVCVSAGDLQEFGPGLDDKGSSILQDIYGLFPYDNDVSNFGDIFRRLYD